LPELIHITPILALRVLIRGGGKIKVENLFFFCLSEFFGSKIVGNLGQHEANLSEKSGKAAKGSKMKQTCRKKGGGKKGAGGKGQHNLFPRGM
jgi:hypothetical protein